jgi:AraC-like DNA-binding protein
MRQFDRLTSLMTHFTLQVRKAPAETAQLLVCVDEIGTPLRVVFRSDTSIGLPTASLLFAADVTWGGAANPLLSALPPLIELDLTDDPDGASLVQLLNAELIGNRCGAPSVTNRLAEILMVRLLRKQIEDGATEPGLLSGLADPRLSRCIVAMHDNPRRSWTNPDLADAAGLSLSRFTEIFQTKVGQPPQAYLRQWRLTLAQREIERGERIGTVARRYGYRSSEAFSRAFKQRYGKSPVKLRQMHG